MRRKLRVLISINMSWNIYNFRAPLIRALQNEGYEVLTAAPEDDYSERLRTLVTGHHHISMSNAGTSPIQDFLLFCRYVMLLKRLRPSVMLSYTIKPNIYGSFACRLLGIPIINNVSGLGTVFIKQNWLTWIVKALYSKAFKYSSHVFFQNDEDHRLFIQEGLVEAEKTEIIPGSGIDLERYKPHPETPRDHLNFVLIARMLFDKGIGEYVEAARIVKNHYPDAVFNMVGPTGVENRTAVSIEMIRQWETEGVIHYLGETDDVPSIIADHAAVVLPSYREGMSRVLLEGLAMGKPLIATNVPGCKHTIDDGINGFLCNVKDADDLAEKMIQFIELSDERRVEMGKASRRKAVEEFDQKIVLKSYLRKIAELVH